MSDVLTDLRDLRRRALREHSHRYTATVIRRAIEEIEILEDNMRQRHDYERQILEETESLSRQLAMAFQELHSLRAAVGVKS